MTWWIRTHRLRCLLLAVLCLIVAACVPDEEPEDPDPVEDEEQVEEEDREIGEGGTVVWAYDQEPGTLLPVVEDGNLYATSQITLATLLPLWVITPDFEYEPTALLDSAETANEDADADAEDPAPEDQFQVTYTLNEDATWSDGEPITASDLFFTIEVNLHPDIEIASRAGWDEIDVDTTEEHMDPDSHELTVYFDAPYGPWQDAIFNKAEGVVFPEHVLADQLGEDFNDVFEDGIVDPETDEPIASGPFMFDSWERGQQAELVRNDNYETYAGENAHLDRLVFRFIPDINTQLQQLRGGEIDMMDPQLQLDMLPQVEQMDGVEFQTDVGPTWEHLDFQHTREPLDQTYVRQAIAMAIDRESFVDEFITALDPDAEPLNSHVYVRNVDEYEDHLSDVVPYDPDEAVELLEDNGCERDDDDVFVCEGERMEFDITSTADNERRDLFFQFMQEDLADVGIEVSEDFGDSATVFSGEVLAAGDWDIFLFAWVGSPDPVDNVEIYGCYEREDDGGIAGPAGPDDIEDEMEDERYGNQNYHRFCPAEEVSETLWRSNFELEEQARADLINEAGAALAEDVPTLPIFQMPNFLAYRDDLMGLEINTTQWGQTWNVADWGLAE